MWTPMSQFRSHGELTGFMKSADDLARQVSLSWFSTYSHVHATFRTFILFFHSIRSPSVFHFPSPRYIFVSALLYISLVHHSALVSSSSPFHHTLHLSFSFFQIKFIYCVRWLSTNSFCFLIIIAVVSIERRMLKPPLHRQYCYADRGHVSFPSK